MKKIILSVFILVSVIGSLVAQKPKDIRQKTNARSVKTTDIKPPSDYHEIGVPETNRIFEGSSAIKSISTLLRPSQALPRGFKVISAQDGLPTMIQGSMPDASVREAPLSTRTDTQAKPEAYQQKVQRERENERSETRVERK